MRNTQEGGREGAGEGQGEGGASSLFGVLVWSSYLFHMKLKIARDALQGVFPHSHEEVGLSAANSMAGVLAGES